jgi:hypothetical protein
LKALYLTESQKAERERLLNLPSKYIDFQRFTNALIEVLMYHSLRIIKNYYSE